MYALAFIQFLIVTFTVTVSCKALPPYLGLRSRDFTGSSDAHKAISKRANGQDLWDRLQIRLSDCGDTDDSAADSTKEQDFKLYAPLRTPFQKDDEKETAGFDIRETIRNLAQTGDVDPEFSFRMTTNAAKPNQDSVCFQHNFLTTKGIVIVENVDRSKDMVPKNRQLSWSDIVFYTYKEMNHGDVSNLQYIFHHSITNEGTKAAINNAYTASNLDRNTEVSWTYEDPAKRASFLALLETRNAQGAAYILTDHAVAMGKKNIKQIVTLPYDASKSYARPCMYIELG